MKIRNGFVSNSSSSSFLVYGTSIDFDSITDDVYEKGSKISQKTKYPYTVEEIKDGGRYEIGEMLAELVDMEFNTIEYDDDEIIIGVSPETQPDEMTHGDWKLDIKTRLKEVLPNVDLSFGWFEDCSYDG